MKKHKIQECFINQNLASTDSTSLFFFFCCFFCDLTSQVNKKNSSKIIFEVLTQLKILNRHNYDFCTQFCVCDPKRKKQVRLYENESIGNANIVTISINPKEYFIKYNDENINKKH